MYLNLSKHHSLLRLKQEKEKYYVCVTDGNRIWVWTYLSSGMHLARSPISPLRAAILTSSLRVICFISLAFQFFSLFGTFVGTPYTQKVLLYRDTHKHST